ncbi:hypothetical protein B0H16DRAFT_1545319 [Mycena metata]|uniref:Uncharacterized protein n=1 Tax=Mycena metata TaxID=1033252 RepID=A0AAD7NAQ7_9AGAR|nr:hypothetical protein B0H16DRAFT_1545319 [Mycena metata]
MRTLGERWVALPAVLRSSISALAHSPSMHHLDFTGFGGLDPALFSDCRGLKSLKLSEISGPLLTRGSGSQEAGPALRESLTVLDTVYAESTMAWAISTPSFRGLRHLRVG